MSSHAPKAWKLFIYFVDDSNIGHGIQFADVFQTSAASGSTGLQTEENCVSSNTRCIKG
ncbi:hypothetical protein QTP88_024178 [Uroleucon formosanum]